MEILSYLIVLVISRISLAISSFLSIPISLLFAWLPENKLAPVVSFFSGIIGPFISVLTSKYIFSEVGGYTNYTLVMYLAAILPMFIPIIKDYKKYRELKNEEYESMIDFSSEAPSKASTMGSFPMGAIFGMALCLLLF